MNAEMDISKNQWRSTGGKGTTRKNKRVWVGLGLSLNSLVGYPKMLVVLGIKPVGKILALVHIIFKLSVS